MSNYYIEKIGFVYILMCFQQFLPCPDPLKCNLATKPIKQIGLKLQKQYETWQRRARYKQSLDPTIEEVRMHR